MIARSPDKIGDPITDEEWSTHRHVVTDAEAEQWVAAFINSTKADRVSMARAVLEVAYTNLRQHAALRKIKMMMERSRR